MLTSDEEERNLREARHVHNLLSRVQNLVQSLLSAHKRKLLKRKLQTAKRYVLEDKLSKAGKILKEGLRKYSKAKRRKVPLVEKVTDQDQSDLKYYPVVNESVFQNTFVKEDTLSDSDDSENIEFLKKQQKMQKNDVKSEKIQNGPLMCLKNSHKSMRGKTKPKTQFQCCAFT